MLSDFFHWLQELLAFIRLNPALLMILGVLALGPAIFWGWLYYRKIKMDNAHRRLMVRTFIIGTLSVLPVMGISYLMKRWFDFDLNFFIQKSTATRAFSFAIVGFMIIGVLEEYSKMLVVREVDYKQKAFNRIADGIEFGVAAALGFAFTENIVYFFQALDLFAINDISFISIVVVRSLGSMFAHTVFSGIFGYYYGKAKFVGLPTPKDERQMFKFHFHRALRVRYHRYKHLLMGHNIHGQKDFQGQLHEDELIAEGLLIAASLHAIYDLLLAYQKGHWIIPLVFLEYLIIVHEMHIHRNVEVHHFQAR